MAPDAERSPSHPEPSPAHRPSRLRRWMFRLIITVVIPLVLLGMLEGGLRIGGYGYRPGFLIKDGDRYQSNPRFGWRFFPRRISRAPLPISLAADKPANTYRIVIVGGSAARGYPDPAFSFSRYLEVMLRDRYPSMRLELASAAMTAANSHMMRPAARDCVKLKPDLVIIYMGNNEVVGPYGPGTVFAGASPSLRAIHAGLWVKGTRIGQLLGNLTAPSGGGSGEWGGMSMFLDNLVSADDARLADTYSHFRSNLEDICQAGLDAGAGVVICTVPVNVRDCAPFASTYGDGLAPDDLARWREAYDQGIADEKVGQYEQAARRFTEAMAIDDGSADLHFRLGRCYVGLAKSDQAAEHFRQARELDTLRFRADATINETIRQVAEDSDGKVTLADAELAFDVLADVAGCPGEELFFDHVHPNFRGNYEMARSVFGVVAPRLPAEVAGRVNTESPEFERCNELLALTHLERLRIAASLWRLTQKAPFTNQLNYGAMRARMLARREGLWAQSVLAADMLAIYDSASAAAPDDATLHLLAATIHAQRQNFPVVARHLAEARRLRPNDPKLSFIEATMHLGQGRLAPARQAADTYLELLDHSLDAYIAVINLLGVRGKTAEAEAYARQALKRMPRQASALTLLANTIRLNRLTDQAGYRQGLAEAEDLLTEATELEPTYSNAWLELGEVQVTSGRVSEATASFRRAVELDPSLQPAYVAMGTLLYRQGKVKQAKACLARAVSLSPDDVVAASKYAELLCFEGRVRRGVALLQRALRIDPGAPVAGILAWVLATSADADLRDAPEAMRLARVAVTASRGRPSSMLVLAAAHAASGEFPQAIDVATQALIQARRQGDARLVERLQDHLGLYGEGRALHIDAYDRLEGW